MSVRKLKARRGAKQMPIVVRDPRTRMVLKRKRPQPSR
jgi:hypothetical protein